VWRLWRGKGTSDVYVAARTLGGVVKVSLHESGEYRYAFTNEYWKSSASRGAGPRVMERWNRPPPIQGITPAFTIAVPSDEIRVPRLPLPEGTNNKYTKNATWIAPAPPGFSTQFDVLFTGPDGPEPVPENRFLDRFVLSNGETVNILIQELPVTEAQQQLIRLSRQRISEYVAKGEWAARGELEASPEPRVWLYGHSDNGARFFIDISADFLFG
jgi:hypothetical protein